MILDISVPLSPEMPTFPGDPHFKRWLSCDMSIGSAANTSHLDFGAHTGTHVDAPIHMLEGGSDVTAFPLESLIGEAVVVEIEDEKSISLPALKKISLPQEGRILFKTRNSALWKRKIFEKNFVHLELEAADYLASLGTRLVGIDYLSVEKFGSVEFPVHLSLMRKNTIILEGIDLSKVTPGRYRIFCGPMKIVGSDGAPARVLLEGVSN